MAEKIQYDTKYICTYPHIYELLHEMGMKLDTNDETCMDHVKYVSYKNDILAIFKINENEEKKINCCISLLYERMREIKEIKECCHHLASLVNSTDLSVGFAMLFAYDYLYISHTCISEFLETGKICEENMKKLYP
jgi:hypothetical protein